jgi:hypothetical protein
VDRLLREAERVLKSNAPLAREFFDRMGYANDPEIQKIVAKVAEMAKPPELVVRYYSGEDQEWGGAPEDWPDHAREYEVMNSQVREWYLLYHDQWAVSGMSMWPEPPTNLAMTPYVQSMEALGRPVNMYELRPNEEDFDAPNYDEFYDEDGVLLFDEAGNRL